MKRITNPLLPNYEYIPDGEPHVFGDRVYLYGSHDRFNGRSFCLNDYVCWSAPLCDLGDWRYEGIIYRKEQDATYQQTHQTNRSKQNLVDSMYAPDVCQGIDGRYYLYYFIGYQGIISVAVCDTPCGQFSYLGDVHYENGDRLGSRNEPLQFDPGVFVEGEHVYLYTGFAPMHYPSFLMKGHKPSKLGAMGMKLKADMLTIEGDLHTIGVPSEHSAKGTAFEGHAFFEASSLRKFDDTYYFIYSSQHGHELCYATSHQPLGDFTFGGVLISNGDLPFYNQPQLPMGNNHGSLIALNDNYYIFYHRHSNRNAFSRQACVEVIQKNGKHFLQAKMTSFGIYGQALPADGCYSAAIASGMGGKGKNPFYGVFKLPTRNPYFTQTGNDREHSPDQYITNLKKGSWVRFDCFDFTQPTTLTLQTSGNMRGEIHLYLDGNYAATTKITPQLCPTFSIADTGQHTVTLHFAVHGKGNLHNLTFA